MQTPQHSYESGAPEARQHSTPSSMGTYPSWEAPEELARRTAQADRRRGLTGAWIDLVAPPPAAPEAALAERERVRRAELSGYVLLGVLLVGLALIPNGLANLPTLLSAGVIIASAVAAGLLNRNDHTTSAALVLIAAFTLALGGALLWAPRLDLMWMPALDFFAVPVLLAAILLPRLVPFLVGGVNIALITALLLLKPRDPALAGMMASLGIYHFLVRPAMLIVIVAIAGWLWSRSVEQAIARADRAEEVATAEHQLVRQKALLERGIQGLLETHVRIANGDFSARAHAGQDNVLWQIALSLNNLASRLGKWAQVDQRLRRTDAEIDRLAGALERARQGQRAQWPALSGTQVDRLIMLLAAAAPARGQQVVSAASERQRGQIRSQIGPMGGTQGSLGGRGAARPAGPMPGVMAQPWADSAAESLPGQWREASIQHVAPRTPPFQMAQPPLGAPMPPPSRVSPAAGFANAANAADAWARPDPGYVGVDGAAPNSPHVHPNVPGETLPRLDSVRPGAPESAYASRRARTHAYRQDPLPAWLTSHLPPVAAARGARSAARDEAPADSIARVTPDAPLTDVPGGYDAATGAARPMIEHPTIELDAVPTEVVPAAASDGRTGERTNYTTDGEPLADFAPAPWADREQAIHHSEGTADWPEYLRQLGQVSD